jgi:hypothetical protein
LEVLKENKIIQHGNNFIGHLISSNILVQGKPICNASHDMMGNYIPKFPNVLVYLTIILGNALATKYYVKDLELHFWFIMHNVHIGQFLHFSMNYQFQAF